MKRRGFLQALAALPLWGIGLKPKPKPPGKWYFECSLSPAATIHAAIDTSTRKVWFARNGVWARGLFVQLVQGDSLFWRLKSGDDLP